MDTIRLSKGEQTKALILERANALFNAYGLGHTITEIAKHIGMGKSRITNYFPKKEDLVIDLLKEYETQLDSLLSKHRPDEEVSDFVRFIPYLSDVVELMFRYRGVISQVMLSPKKDEDTLQHIKLNYALNRKRIRSRLENFEKNGLITPKLLDSDSFEEYFFQYVCISSNWITTHNLLYPGKDLDTLKPRYIRSILCCVRPYLTAKGLKNLETALLTLDQAPTPNGRPREVG